MTRRVAVYLLAGGQSSRFGSDKARIETPEGPLLQHIAKRLQPVATRITVVADRAEKYVDLGFPTIPDAYPGRGPLCGILTALKHHCSTDGPGWILAASCDLIGIRHEWALELLRHVTPELGAVAFCTSHWEPLLALYHTRLQGLAEDLLNGPGRAGPARLLDQVRAHKVPLPEGFTALPQVNTRAELQRLLESAFAQSPTRRGGIRVPGELNG